MVSNETLIKLTNESVLTKSINREFENDFGKKNAKIGYNLRVRLPNVFSVVQNSQALSLQAIDEQYTNVTITDQSHVDFTFDTADLTWDVDRFSERYTDPAAVSLVAQIEANCFARVTPLISAFAGTPGTVQTSLATGALLARKILNQNLCPDDGKRTAIMTADASASMQSALSVLFNPEQSISDMYEKGKIGRGQGFQYRESNLNWSTPSSGLTGTALIAGSNQFGLTLNIDGITGTTVKKGTVITIAACYAVNPQTNGAYTYLQTFAVAADAPVVSGAATLTLATPINTLVSSDTNCPTVDVLPQDEAVVTFVTSTGSYGQNIYFHKDFASFVNPELVMPEGLDFAGRASKDGYSIRIVRQYLIGDDTIPTRLDSMWGISVIRPQLACRISD